MTFNIDEKRLRNGFTLIELLIVVAIISILSSIAVPNFLEAQTRAKVSRAKADMRTMANALETYRVDHNNYPYRRHPMWKDGYYAPRSETRAQETKPLTTPVSYISNLPMDIFETHVPPPNNIYNYFDPEQVNVLINKAHNLNPDHPTPELRRDAGARYWLLLSVGPDGYIGVNDAGNPGDYPDQPVAMGLDHTIYFEYDPTNGTIGPGNIYRMQGGLIFENVLTREYYD